MAGGKTATHGALRVVFSDLHFGDPHSLLQSERVRKGLHTFFRSLGREVRELILAGDILDANIATLTAAIEGSAVPGENAHGLREWLAMLLTDQPFKMTRIVYVPGNHDYVIWNLLSTEKAFTQPLARGQRLTGQPLMAGFFSNPFISGIAPKSHRDRFVVGYPDYQFVHAGKKVIVTHGHYLDRSQSLFQTLDRILAKRRWDERRAVREFFIMTAQYQALAHAVSYTRQTRVLVDRVHKAVEKAFGGIGRLRNKSIGPRILDAIELYLTCFHPGARPDVYIFGHTHRSDHALSTAFGSRRKRRLIPKPFHVHNTGGFVAEKRARRAGTFLVLHEADDAGSIVTHYAIDRTGNVTRLAT
jgi:UDP-2,3-diacylglucosamine pyrophosphatase LpxH